MNHSKKFWTLVQKMMDDLELWDYKKHKRWLNKNWDKLIF
jgi:predicted metal-dependent hydrolase